MLEEGVHHDIRIFGVTESQRPPCFQVDIYGGPENVCGTVTIMSEDLRPNTRLTLDAWEENETPLTVLVGKGRVVLTERPGTGGVLGWRAADPE